MINILWFSSDFYPYVLMLSFCHLVNDFPLTFLTMLLLSYMESNGSIVFTSSGTHNPEEKTGIEKAAYISARDGIHTKASY